MEVKDRGLDSGGIAAELATVPVESVEVTGLIDDIEEAALLGYLSTLDAVDADRRIEHMELERALVTIDREELRSQRTEAQEQLARVRVLLTELAVVSYVEGGVSLAFDDEWSVADDNAEATSREALVQVSRSQIAARDELVLRIEGLTIEIDDRTARLESLAADILEQTARREGAAVAQVQYQADVERLTPQVGPGSGPGRRRRSRDLDGGARRLLPSRTPDGRRTPVVWYRVGDAGRDRSHREPARHLRRRGRHPDRADPGSGDRHPAGRRERDARDPRQRRRRRWTATCEFDRAVGPMQFIPTTWQRFARDGDGNGAADPHNLYDAALSAAEYLCRGRSNLHDSQRAGRARSSRTTTATRTCPLSCAGAGPTRSPISRRSFPPPLPTRVERARRNRRALDLLARSFVADARSMCARRHIRVLPCRSASGGVREPHRVMRFLRPPAPHLHHDRTPWGTP